MQMSACACDVVMSADGGDRRGDGVDADGVDVEDKGDVGSAVLCSCGLYVIARTGLGARCVDNLEPVSIEYSSMKTDTTTRVFVELAMLPPSLPRCWLFSEFLRCLVLAPVPEDAASASTTSVVTTVRVIAITDAVGLNAAITSPPLRRSTTCSSPALTPSLGTSRCGPRRSTAAPNRGAITTLPGNSTSSPPLSLSLAKHTQYPNFAWVLHVHQW